MQRREQEEEGLRAPIWDAGCPQVSAVSQLGLCQASLQSRLGIFGRQRVRKRRQKSLSECWSPSSQSRRLCSPSLGASRFHRSRPRSPCHRGVSGDPHLPGPPGTGMLGKGRAH